MPMFNGYSNMKEMLNKKLDDIQYAVDELPPYIKERLSDGYHSFAELYQHRTILYITLCRVVDQHYPVWKSKVQSDGTSNDGWFLLGINISQGEQITYHLSTEYWDECSFARELEKAPEYDNHSSEDVLTRLIKYVR